MTKKTVTAASGEGMKINVWGDLNIKDVFLKPNYETCKKLKRSTREKIKAIKQSVKGQGCQN